MRAASFLAVPESSFSVTDKQTELRCWLRLPLLDLACMIQLQLQLQQLPRRDSSTQTILMSSTSEHHANHICLHTCHPHSSLAHLPSTKQLMFGSGRPGCCSPPAPGEPQERTLAPLEEYVCADKRTETRHKPGRDIYRRDPLISVMNDSRSGQAVL